MSGIKLVMTGFYYIQEWGMWSLVLQTGSCFCNRDMFINFKWLSNIFTKMKINVAHIGDECYY